MTTIQISKDIVNEYTILSVKMNERRNKVIEKALLEYLENHKKEYEEKEK